MSTSTDTEGFTLHDDFYDSARRAGLQSLRHLDCLENFLKDAQFAASRPGAEKRVELNDKDVGKVLIKEDGKKTAFSLEHVRELAKLGTQEGIEEFFTHYPYKTRRAEEKLIVITQGAYGEMAHIGAALRAIHNLQHGGNYNLASRAVKELGSQHQFPHWVESALTVAREAFAPVSIAASGNIYFDLSDMAGTGSNYSYVQPEGKGDPARLCQEISAFRANAKKGGGNGLGVAVDDELLKQAERIYNSVAVLNSQHWHQELLPTVYDMHVLRNAADTDAEKNMVLKAVKYMDAMCQKYNWGYSPNNNNTLSLQEIRRLGEDIPNQVRHILPDLENVYTKAESAYNAFGDEFADRQRNRHGGPWPRLEDPMLGPDRRFQLQVRTQIDNPRVTGQQAR